MICTEDRRKMNEEIEVARRAGARLKPACELVGIRSRTLQRWKASSGLECGDGRGHAVRLMPSHALTPAEREEIVRVANEARFAELPPARIVPMLADEGIYIASESSFHRVLRAQGQMRHRGRARAPHKTRPPSTHVATAIRQVWTWDMTFLPAEVLGRFFYLYNHDHRHSGIRYVSPAQRHAGEDRPILAARHELYTQAKAANPRRWSRHTRNWAPIAAVTLDPERDSVVQAVTNEEKNRSAA